MRAHADQPAAPAGPDRRWGEKRTLRLVARYADACNVFGTTPADVAHKSEVLRGHCADADREYDSIEKTVLVTRPALVDVDALAELAEVAEYAGVWSLPRSEVSRGRPGKSTRGVAASHRRPVGRSRRTNGPPR